MNILIAGGGKVGYNIAKQLYKKHNITIIDKDEEKINFINESLDVLCIIGDLRDSLTYESLEKEYDYFIGVTDNDELNLITSLTIEDFTNIKYKIVRLQNSSYSLTKINEKLNIKPIYSNIIPISSIEKLIELPQANNIKNLFFTEMVLVSVKSEIDVNIEEIENDKVKVIALIDEKENINFNIKKIQKNSLIYVMGEIKHLKKILKKLAPSQPETIKNVLIFGANDLGIEIANTLYSQNLNITIIESDPNLAHKVAKKLNENILIINASFDDENYFLSENLQKNDVSIAATSSDEKNILKSLISKRYGIKKTICINNNPYYHSIMNSLNLSIIRGPKIATAYKILETIESEKIIFEKLFLNFNAKVYIKKIFFEKKIQPPKLNCKILILRENSLIEIKEEFKVIPEDIVFYFTKSGDKKWIENL